MSFETLPVELKLSILELLEPQWSFNFAITSKEQFELCQSILEHHTEQFSKWHTIDFLGDEDDLGFEDCTLPWSILEAILDDTRKGWYIKQLDLSSDRLVEWNDRNSDTLPEKYHDWDDSSSDTLPPRKYREFFKAAARALGDLYPVTDRAGVAEDLVTELEKCIDEGFGDPIAAILIHHLPYLEIINITDSGLTTCFLDVVYRLAMDYEQPAKASKLPFQRLKTATVSHWDTEGGCDASWDFCFLCIPSLQTFAARDMGHAFTPRNFESLGVHSGRLSNVSELFFVECCFDLDQLQLMLRMTKALKKLTYTEEGYTTWAVDTNEPTKLLQCIVTCLADSLQVLVLGYDTSIWRDDSYDEPSSSSSLLRNCSKLRILNCNRCMLRPPVDDVTTTSTLPQDSGTAYDGRKNCVFDIRAGLPRQLERLYIHGSFERDEWDDLTKSLINVQNTFPNLVKLRVQRLNPVTGVEEVFGNAKRPPSLYRGPPGTLINVNFR